MNIWEGYNSIKKAVSFDIQDKLCDKISKHISMMSKLSAKGNNWNRLFKPKIYQGKRREQDGNNYDQGRYRSNSGDRYSRLPYRGRSQYVQNYKGNLRKRNFREMQNYRGKKFRGGYRSSLRNSNFDRGRSSSRERQFSGNFRRNDRSSSRSRSGSRTSTNRDRVRCLKCREYDHFAKDSSNMLETEKDQTEQMQQMLDSEEHETALKVFCGRYLWRFD